MQGVIGRESTQLADSSCKPQGAYTDLGARDEVVDDRVKESHRAGLDTGVEATDETKWTVSVLIAESLTFTINADRVRQTGRDV